MSVRVLGEMICKRGSRDRCTVVTHARGRWLWVDLRLRVLAASRPEVAGFCDFRLRLAMDSSLSGWSGADKR